MNDPDVFLLRDTNIKTTFEQRKLQSKINSDNTDEYSTNQLKALYDAFADRDVVIKRAEFTDKNIIETEYTENGVEKMLKFDVQNGILYW